MDQSEVVSPGNRLLGFSSSSCNLRGGQPGLLSTEGRYRETIRDSGLPVQNLLDSDRLVANLCIAEPDFEAGDPQFVFKLKTHQRLAFSLA